MRCDRSDLRASAFCICVRLQNVFRSVEEIKIVASILFQNKLLVRTKGPNGKNVPVIGICD